MPDAAKVPVPFNVIKFPTTCPVALIRLLLTLVMVNPFWLAATVSTRARTPVMLTLLPLMVPLRTTEAIWLGVRSVPINPLTPIGSYWMEQPVCVIVVVPLPRIVLVNESVSIGATIA